LSSYHFIWWVPTGIFEKDNWLKYKKSAPQANRMISINYPALDFRIKEENGNEFIFDAFRRQWVRLTPEEWVRQNMLQFLTQVKKYPSSLIAVEKEIMIGELKKRFDIVVYRSSRPWMVIECKEMKVPLNESVLRQALNYNIRLQTDYLIISNGAEVYGFGLKDGKAEMIEAFPDY
jgi:hypothetical protein